MARNIRLCDIGVKILKFFLLTSTAIVFSFVLFGLILKTWNFGANPFLWITTGVGLFVIEFVLFWIGIIMVYVSSLQLGFKTRLLGIICGWIPIVNLFTLMKIIRICSEEVALERRLLTRDLARKDEQVCRTRYPILLVHGVFFRDFEHFNYWGRIPKELEKNGGRGRQRQRTGKADPGHRPPDGMRKSKHHRAFQGRPGFARRDRRDFSRRVRRIPDDDQHAA